MSEPVVSDLVSGGVGAGGVGGSGAIDSVPSRSCRRSRPSAARCRGRPLESGAGGRGSAPSLLSRAFELTGHQESILTRPAADDTPAGGSNGDDPVRSESATVDCRPTDRLTD